MSELPMCDHGNVGDCWKCDSIRMWGMVGAASKERDEARTALSRAESQIAKLRCVLSDTQMCVTHALAIRGDAELEAAQIEIANVLRGSAQRDEARTALSRAESQIAKLREVLGWIVNASGMSDLDDYYQFVDEHARAALRETEPGK